MIYGAKRAMSSETHFTESGSSPPDGDSTSTSASEARWLARQGFHPTALKPGSKGTNLRGWDTSEHRPDPAVDDFVLFSPENNLGVLNGTLSAEAGDV